MFSIVTLNALLAGGAMSLLLGPLGCFVVWRRMAYFGDAVSHAALLGVALSLIFSLPMTGAILGVTLLLAGLLTAWIRDIRFHADTVLGFLAHGMLAVGLIAVALSDQAQFDLNAYLFGDILSVSAGEIYTVALLSLAGLAVIAWHWQGLVLATLEPNLAAVEGYPVMRLNYILVGVLAATIAVAIKIVGVLLITALLIMPAAAARPLAKSPGAMATLAALCALTSIVGGIFAAIALDAPTGPMIVVVAMVLCILTMIVSRLMKHPR